MNKISILKCVASAGLLALSATQAVAAVTWATWSNSTTATLGGVGVTMTGEGGFLDIDSRNWQPTTTWADGVLIPNAPVAGTAARTLIGGPGKGTNTITFTQVVTSPVLAFFSLGQLPIAANFTFE